MDVLNNILSAMRLSGSVFLEAKFSAPWCVSSHLDPDDCVAFFRAPAHIISYHYVAKGEFWCAVDGGAPIPVHAGQVLMIPRNDRHLLGSTLALAPVDARTLMEPVGDGSRAHIDWGGGGESSEIYCGFLGTLTPVGALLQSLPSILVVDVGDGPTGEWLATSIRYAATAEAGQSPETVGRLSELLLLEAVRQYMASLPDDHTGWLAGLRDRHVSRALTLLHERYAEDWTTEALARDVGLSRSAMAERFTRLIGEPPMRYLSQHRMNIAANLLREQHENSSNVAYAVGFSSEAAFSRAFKKTFGQAPGSWRRA